MGIDGFEFHKSQHQNMGTTQEAWLFQNFFWLKFSPPPWSNDIKKNNRKSIFFKLQGVEVSPSHEDNSWWESVGQVESIKKIMKNMTTGQVTKVMRINNLLTSCYFSKFW